MKKTLIALAALAAVSAASAQSTVTLFGGADLNYRTVTSGANKFSGMAQDGIYSSRFGVSGTEDLGGGLKANFHFEGGMNPDVGTPAVNFTRKSTIGVAGGFGEVRLGRDYTPLFTVAGIADPFGTNGVGSSYNLVAGVTNNTGTTTRTEGSTFRTKQTASAPGTNAGSTILGGSVFADPNAVRSNNSVTYYTPNINGFNASAMYGFGAENANLAKSAAKMTSVKLAYAAGPLSVAFANQQTKGGLTGAAAVAAVTGTTTPTVIADVAAVAVVLPTDDQKWTTNFLAGSYNLGVARVSAGFKTDKTTAIPGTFKSTILGVVAPMGALTLKASYITRKLNSATVGDQVAVGGVYDLSKRTSLYGTYSVLNNGNNYGASVGSAAASDFTGLNSKGFEVGVKHNF